MTDEERKAAWLGFAGEALARIGETPEGQAALDNFLAAAGVLAERIGEVAPGMLPKLVKTVMVTR